MKLLTIITIVVEVFLLLPIFYIFFNFSLDWNILKESIVSLANSIVISSLASFISLLLSIIISYNMIKTSRYISLVIAGMLMSIPDIVLGISLLMLYGKEGMIGLVFGNIFVNKTLGIIIAESYIILPYSIIIVFSIFKNTSRSYIESAYALGANNYHILKYIYIKFNKILLLKTFINSISYGLSVFGVVVIFSYYPKIMTTEIFEKFQLFEYKEALSFSGLLLVVSLLLYTLSIIIERKFKLPD